MLFAVAEAEVAEAVCSTMHGDGGQKYILVDSGATTSCASAKHFPNAALDASKRKQLWAINGTPIQQQGGACSSHHPFSNNSRRSGHQNSCKVSFGLHRHHRTGDGLFAASWMMPIATCTSTVHPPASRRTFQTPDDQTIVLPRFGSRFYMPFEDRTNRHEDDVSAAPAEESTAEDGSVDVDLDGQPESPQPRHLLAPVAPTDDERALPHPC